MPLWNLQDTKFEHLHGMSKAKMQKSLQLVAADVNNKESLIRAFQVIPVSYVRNDPSR